MAESSERDKVEVRVMVPREVVDVLDAVSISGKKDRSWLVNYLLERWAFMEQRKATVVARTAPVTPSAPDTGWGSFL